MSTIVSIAVGVLIVLIVGGFLLAWFFLTQVSRTEHSEKLREVDGIKYEVSQLLHDMSDYDVFAEELDGGTIKLTHPLSDATALYDPANEALHLMSEGIDNRTQDCHSQEVAEMEFDDFIRTIWETAQNYVPYVVKKPDD